MVKSPATLKWRGDAPLLYRFQLTGSDARNALQISNHSAKAGMVQVSTKSSNDSAPDNMVRKIAVGESVLIERNDQEQGATGDDEAQRALARRRARNIANSN